MKYFSLFFFLLAIGCTQSLPVEIHLDKTFSDEDRAIVLEAIAEWNDPASPLLRNEEKIFIVGEDIGPFHKLPELGDKLFGFYNVDIKFTPPHRNPGDSFGYTTLNDILLFSNYIRFVYDEIATAYPDSTYVVQKLNVTVDDTDVRGMIDVVTDEIRDAQYSLIDEDRRARIIRNIIKKVSIHELGHLLGMMHYFHREGMMVPGVSKTITSKEGPHLSDADLEDFCILYDCK